MKSIISAVMVCALAACGGTDSSLISKTQQAVRAKLKDPDSAKFGEAYVVTPEEESTRYTNLRTVCGDVSAKNSYGAYDGRIRFVAFLGSTQKNDEVELLTLEIEKKPNDRIFEIVNWQTDCKKQASS